MKRLTSMVLVALLAFGAAGALAGCGLRDKAVENTTGQIDVAKDATVKAQLMMIKTGIQAFSSPTARRRPTPLRRPSAAWSARGPPTRSATRR